MKECKCLAIERVRVEDVFACKEHTRLIAQPERQMFGRCIECRKLYWAKWITVGECPK